MANEDTAMTDDAQPVWDAPAAPDRRRQAIAAALQAWDGRAHHVPAEGGYLEVPLIELDADLLLYRVDNGRILSELAGAAEARGVDMESLKAQAESAELQRLLHGLLLDKARDPAGPIYQELEVHARQTEPLLVDRAGVVLNGNRRLAAMRELARQDPDRYARFTTVHTAVLPDDIDRAQQEYIEAALQMAPDLKLDYSWINRRLKLRQHARDMARERVVAAYRFRDADEIDTELAELELAERYLAWIGAPGHYARIAEEGDRFEALNAHLAALGQPHLRELWRLIGFAMIRAQASIDRKIDHYYPLTDPAPPAVRQWVLRSLAEEHDLVEPQHAGQHQPVDPQLAERLRPLLDDPDHPERIARAAIDLIDKLKSDPDRFLGGSRILLSLRNARKALETLDTAGLSPEQRRQILGEIGSLQALSREFGGYDGDSADRPRPAGTTPGLKLFGAARRGLDALRRSVTG
jgi:hypothetical protein